MSDFQSLPTDGAVDTERVSNFAQDYTASERKRSDPSMKSTGPRKGHQKKEKWFLCVPPTVRVSVAEPDAQVCLKRDRNEPSGAAVKSRDAEHLVSNPAPPVNNHVTWCVTWPPRLTVCLRCSHVICKLEVRK